MPTEKDNYRELIKNARQSNARPEDWFGEYAADVLHAIDALIKERDKLQAFVDKGDPLGWNMTLSLKCGLLARENERLLGALRHAEMNLGICHCAPTYQCSLCHVREVLYPGNAALANAPTPNDKGK